MKVIHKRESPQSGAMRLKWQHQEFYTHKYSEDFLFFFHTVRHVQEKEMKEDRALYSPASRYLEYIKWKYQNEHS